MARIRSKDMKPEIVVRKLVHALGYRFRLHRKDLPGKPDLVFGPKRKVIFVHGCFWHQHAEEECLDGRVPKSRLEYWGPKLRRNVERDVQSQRALEKSGWGVLVIWECETKEMDALRARLRNFLGAPRSPSKG